MSISRRRRLLLGAVLLAATGAGAAGPGQAQPAPAQAVSPAARPDFSGVWMLRYDGRRVPDAKLRRVDPKAAAERKANDENARRWCQMVGLPTLMDGGAAMINIIQGRDRLAITNDTVPSQARLIFIGGKQPDLSIFEPQIVGHSTATWDGDMLVVDTIGFSDRGLLAIPGGGWRTPKAHLTERYRLLRNGAELRVTFTWTDASVFAAPHTYEFSYVRAPRGTVLRAYRCDSSDEGRAAFINGGAERKGGEPTGR